MENTKNPRNKLPQLFRAYQVQDGNQGSEDRRWLQNSSYNYASQTQEKYHGSSDTDDSSNGNSSTCVIDDIRAPPTAEKRKLDDFDDEGDYEFKKVKRKKVKKEKKKKKHKKEKREETRQTESERNIKQKEALPVQPPGKIFIEDTHGLTPENAYRLDRKPDPNNLSYQSLYTMHIAKYHRATHSVLGLRSNQIVYLGKEKSTKKTNISRYYEKENIGKRKEKNDEISIDMSDAGQKTSKFDRKMVLTETFIPVGSVDEEKITPSDVKSPSNNPLGIYDAITEQYIPGKVPEGVSAAHSQSRIKYKETDFQRIQRQTAEYNRYLYDNPHDVDRWIKYLSFQEEALLVKELDPNHKEKKGRINKALLDIKLSIVEKALEKNPASIVLKKTQLLLVSEIWETTKIAKEWKDLTFKHPNNTEVWWNYLLFLQSNLNSFRVSTIVKAYGKCLSTLDSIRKGRLQSHGDLPHAEKHMLYFLEMLAKFLKHSGHMERAVSVYQAMVEFNLFCPDILKTAEQEKKDFLEAFWDSSVPRFGEDGAKGWADWVVSKGEVPFVSMYSPDTDEITEKEILTRTKERAETWIAFEKSRMSRHWLPWRPNVREGETEEDCEDPERLIMFDDLSALIFEVSSSENKLKLIWTLLFLLGHQSVEQFPSRSSLAHKWQQYQFESFCDIQNKFGLVDNEKFCHGIDFDSCKFIGNVFSQAIGYFEGDCNTRLTLQWIQWKLSGVLSAEVELQRDRKAWKISCKELKKWIKSILKEEANRNNILLWDSYARVENLLGSKDDSTNILDTVLSMNLKAGGLSRIESHTIRCLVCKLCRSSVEFEFDVRNSKRSHGALNTEKVLHILCSLVDNEQYRSLDKDAKVPPTKILRSRKSYQALLEQQLEEVQEDGAASFCSLPESGHILEHIVVCYAYFQYITLDVQAASVIFQQAVARVRAIQSTQEPSSPLDQFNVRSLSMKQLPEGLTEAHISLLKYHIDMQISPLSVLRIPLQQALLEYPDNMRLLGDYAELESRGGIRGQLRRRLHDVAKRAQTPNVWLSAIIAELKSIHRLRSHYMYMFENYKDLPGFTKELPVESSTKHQLRAWFERALDQPQNRSCILLWRLYLYTEVEFGDQSAVHSVYYRAVQQCPRAKMIYLDFVQFFPEKLQEVVDLLVEKELRIRIPIEELDLLIENKQIIGQVETERAQGITQ